MKNDDDDDGGDDNNNNNDHGDNATVRNTIGTGALIEPKDGTRLYIPGVAVPGVPEGGGVAPLRQEPDHGQAEADLEHEEVALEWLAGCFDQR